MSNTEYQLDENDPFFRFIDNDLKNVRCDYEDCTNLTHTVFNMQNLPEKLAGKIKPSYDVFVKLCGKHIDKIGFDVLGEVYTLDFMIASDHSESGYYCMCQRCDHAFVPQSFTPALYYAFKDNFGRLLTRCTKCNQKNWKLPRFRPTPSKAFVKGESATVGKRVITDKVLYRKSIKERKAKIKGGEL